MKSFYLLLMIQCVTCMPPLPPFCDKAFCPQNTNCNNGLTKDASDCCDVCIRKEGEVCGGIDASLGKCEQGLVCNVRHPHSQRNIGLPNVGKAGKCESPVCSMEKCGLHQWCVMKNAKPSCICRKRCHKKISPVCGLTNGVQYKNLCELKREECNLQTSIMALPGPCLGCFKDGKMYSHGDIITTEHFCEKRKCIAGNFVSSIDQKCLEESDIDCSHGSYKHAAVTCLEGYFCKTTKISKYSDYPSFGKCESMKEDACFFDGRTFKVNETFVDSKCSGSCRCHGFNSISCVSLCPPQRVICAHDQTEIEIPQEVSKDPLCHCKVPTCVENRIVCQQPSAPGPCFAYIKRWFFEPNSGRCRPFIFGGCHGNANNFDSKKLCEKTCSAPNKQVIDVIPMMDSAARAGELKHRPSILKKPEMKKKHMLISGVFTFDGKKQILPSPSCLVVSFQDSSLADVPSINLFTQTFNLSNFNTSENFPYNISTFKPADRELFRTFCVHATLHVNSCPSNTSRVKFGDYVMTTAHLLSLRADVNSYRRDVTLECYRCGKMAGKPKARTIFDDNGPALDEAVKEEEGRGEREGGEYFWKGTPRKPQLSDKNMTIKGIIKFPGKVGQLPKGSCLVVSFRDISMADAPSILIGKVKINLTEVTIERSFPFTLTVKKPVSESLGMTHSVSANLNKGWCPTEGSSEWIRKGDYLTDTQFPVALSDEVDDYLSVINITCYDCGIGMEKPEIENDDEDIDEDKIEGNEDSEGELFPFGNGKPQAPELSDKNMTISGEIIFAHNVGMLPNNSCINIKFTDTSLQDVDAITIASVTIPLSGRNIEKSLPYKISCKKPKKENMDMSYEMSATLNYGWCHTDQPDEWIRKGDYDSDWAHSVTLSDAVNEYVENINVTCYDCEGRRPEIKEKETIIEEDEEDEDVVGQGELVFPDGTAPKPKMSNNTIEIKGYVHFPKVVGLLPAESCLTIKLNDVSMADASSITLAKVRFNVSTLNLRDKFEYVLTSQKPDDSELWRTFSLSTVLNKGWCSSNKTGRRWIRKDDYFNDVRHTLDVKADSNEYDANIEVVCYDCDEDEKKKIILSDDLKESSGPKLGNTFMEVYGYLTFKEDLQVLPQGSCIKYAFQDVTEVDGSVYIVKKVYRDVGGMQLKNLTKYKLGFNKPETDEYNRDYMIEAVLNVGWCSKGSANEWIREGDFHTATAHEIKLTKRNFYFKPVNMTKYCVTPSCKPTLSESKTCFDFALNDTFRSGESWERNPCVFCKCVNGEEKCVVAECKPCKNPVFESDKCCPRCLDPEDDETPNKNGTCFDRETNKTYSPGEMWDRDSCTHCMCEEGEPICAISDCVYTLLKPCENLVFTPGVCCPACADTPKVCMDEGTNKSYKEGEMWKPGPCEECSCRNGNPECAATVCPEPECSDPVPLEGECCPVCTNKSDIQDPCTAVRCMKVECENPVQKPGECCLSCATNDTVMDPCKLMKCAKPDCKNPVIKDGKCCPECPPVEPDNKCIDKSTNITHMEGDNWVESDGCTRCMCFGGYPMCASPMCVIPECPGGDIINVKGVCCPVCSTSRICRRGGSKNAYVEGNTWQEDNCDVCRCLPNGIACSAANKQLDGCHDVVKMNKYCGEICLDEPETLNP